VPGHLDQPAAPADHEYRDQRHQQLDDEIEQGAEPGRQLVGEVGNAHVQVEPVTRGRADEGQHDGQENRERLGPRRRAVEHVAGKYRPWDNG
jgi:hypothetical protein